MINTLLAPWPACSSHHWPACSLRRREDGQHSSQTGRRTTLFADGSRKVLFADGNRKVLFADGREIYSSQTGERHTLCADGAHRKGHTLCADGAHRERYTLRSMPPFLPKRSDLSAQHASLSPKELIHTGRYTHHGTHRCYTPREAYLPWYTLLHTQGGIPPWYTLYIHTRTGRKRLKEALRTLRTEEKRLKEALRTLQDR